ncbi:MAG TPA: histidine kinase [Pseudonocardiaceae bacterium]
MTSDAIRPAGERPIEHGPGTGWPGLAGLRALTARHPQAVDALLALGLLLLLFRARAVVEGGVLQDRLFAVLLCAPLALRRRFPLPVFGLLCAVALAQWFLGFLLVSDAALLVALYTVAAHRGRRHAVAAAVVLELGVGLAVIQWGGLFRVLPTLVFLTGMVIAAFVLGVNMRTRRAYLASLEDRALRAERERDQQSQIAAAGERARIAREMHDIVAHNLSVMIALADGAAFAVRTGSPEAHSAARQVSATGRQALAEMHRLLGVLREAAPDASRAPQPGIEQLDDLVSQVRSAGLAVSLTITGRPFELPTTAQLAVYRVAQEALTNVLKHADSPTEACVRLSYRQPVLELEVSDNGTTVGDPSSDSPAGHGLAGMRERAAMFGGDVLAGPGPGGGWRVALRLDIGGEPPAVVDS